VIDLTAATTTKTGLKIYARLDPNTHPDKIKISDEELRSVHLEGHPFIQNGTTPSNPLISQEP
jgi:hypothetical protein